jgi:RNA polymerase sigma factor (sigma-70 family)
MRLNRKSNQNGVRTDESMQGSDITIDAALLQCARAGDRRAHAALYRTYSPMVFTVAYRILGSRAAAEDVLQDSFVEVIRKAGDFRGDSNIGGWIKRIAINKCMSYLRSPWVSRRTTLAASETDGNEQSISVQADGQPQTDPSRNDDQTLKLGRQQELERALAVLSATARAVVWLHDVEGYTHREIGRMMGRSTSFSKTQLSRAYMQLRRELECEETDQEAEPCLGVLKTV